MVAKKSSKPRPPAATRRSARLASRSPSVERDIPEEMDAHVPVPVPMKMRNHSPLERKSTTRRVTSRSPSVESDILERNEVAVAPVESVERRNYTPLERRSATRRRLKMLEIQQAVERMSEKEPSPKVQQTPTVALAPSPENQQIAVAATTDPAPSPPTSTERAAEQPRTGWFQTISKYLASPFARKRPAEEPAERAPSPKRSRQEEKDEGLQTAQQTQYPGEEPQRTPRLEFTPNSPRDDAGPSTKDPKLPSSLPTITENKELSLPSEVSESILEDTPSRPPREQPSKNLIQMPQSTPIRRPVTTPTMRRSAQLRAARAAGTNTPNNAFATRTVIPKPRESNADARLAKLERMQMLQKELAELQQDEDVKEMQSHRLKRVKIDNLVEIPHNRPGDPSGCFRVPEEDSDDEMEVYENVEERTNLFEDVNMEAEHVTTREEQNVERADANMVFKFPDVGPIPRGYYVSEEFKEEAGRLFAAGLAEFLAA